MQLRVGPDIPEGLMLNSKAFENTPCNVIFMLTT